MNFDNELLTITNVQTSVISLCEKINKIADGTAAIDRMSSVIYASKTSQISNSLKKISEKHPSSETTLNLTTIYSQLHNLNEIIKLIRNIKGELINYNNAKKNYNNYITLDPIPKIDEIKIYESSNSFLSEYEKKVAQTAIDNIYKYLNSIIKDSANITNLVYIEINEPVYYSRYKLDINNTFEIIDSLRRTSRKLDNIIQKLVDSISDYGSLNTLKIPPRTFSATATETTYDTGIIKTIGIVRKNVSNIEGIINDNISKLKAYYDKILNFDNFDDFSKSNNLQTIPKVTPVVTASEISTKDNSKSITYTIKTGDTLTKIANKYGLSWQEIYEVNKDIISNPSLIFPGMVLTIPTSKETVSTFNDDNETEILDLNGSDEVQIPKNSNEKTEGAEVVTIKSEENSTEKEEEKKDKADKKVTISENYNIYSPTEVGCTKEEFVNLSDNLWGRNSNTKGGSGKTYQQGYTDNIEPYLDDIYDYAVENNLNPEFVLAIALEESGYGSSSVANNNNNLFGWTAKGGYYNFTSIDEGIKHVCEGLDKNYDTSSVESIAIKYCDASWANRVKGHMKRIDEAINK